MLVIYRALRAGTKLVLWVSSMSARATRELRWCVIGGMRKCADGQTLRNKARRVIRRWGRRWRRMCGQIKKAVKKDKAILTKLTEMTVKLSLHMHLIVM